jgi:putative phage-type endonuclease
MTKPYEIIGHTDLSDWHEKRLLGVGSSEAAILVGESPYAGLYTLWAEKTGETEHPDLSTKESVYWGKKLESVIVDEFSLRTKRTTHLSGELLRSTVYPWAQCTPDAWTHIGNDVVPLEAKNIGLRMESRWEDGPDPYHLWQCQHQLLVTGCDKMSIAALVGGQQHIWADVYRDDIMINRLIYAGEKFWKLVESRTPPEPTAADKGTLKRMYPQDDGQVIELPAVLEDVDSELVELKITKTKFANRIDKEIAACENKIKVAMGNAQIGMLPSRAGYRWKTNKKSRSLTRIKPKQ